MSASDPATKALRSLADGARERPSGWKAAGADPVPRLARAAARIRSGMGHLWRALPLVLLIISMMGAAWTYGVAVGRYRIFPFAIMADGLKTGRVLIGGLHQRPDMGGFQGFSEVPLREARTSRIARVTAGGPVAPQLNQAILFYGGRFTFLDQCPTAGCLAVLYNPDGTVRHAYPLRPDEIFAANVTPELKYEETAFRFALQAYPVGIERYPGGDLLVAFHNQDTFPFGGGVARIAPDGHPRWFRRDYSHHWPKLMADGRALVPGLRIREQPIRLQIHEANQYPIDIACPTGKMLDDTVQIVGGDGRLVRQVSVLDSLLASPFRPALQHTTDRCDPLHLNHIDVVGSDVGDPSGVVRPGDFIVSLRNISSIGVIDGDSGRFKRLLRGSFLQQHSVSYWRDGKVLMFDNHGGGPEGGPSRLVAVDLVSGVERAMFPTGNTVEPFRDLFSNQSGKIDISPDGERAIVTFTEASQAVEVRLDDGAVLNVFRSLHDASSVTALEEDERARKAVEFRLYGVDYVGAAEEGD